MGRTGEEVSVGHPVILYDGTCGFCNRVVQFIIPRDRGGRFRFAAIQSVTGKRLLVEQGIDPEHLNTFVLMAEGRMFTRSTAALEVARRLDGAWPLFYAFIAVPGVIRDGVYHFIARNRYRWFGRTEACMLPDAKVRERFLER